uniref:Amidase domain-containing protein n=1 Tax=uncultured Thiotrichaceae bacterium TaxID=298394 RepID=A0A6S6UNU5_9GAMM|nr:MAG: Unknown protein [uncultured Thiotrichaceae bacterium]
MNEITAWSAVETAQKIREREVSCTEVTKAHLDFVELANPVLNAIVESDPKQALATAAEYDNNWKAEGLPPLYGVPVTTKINVDQAGSATSNGLPALTENIATEDSPVVANLKQDGAIIIGRTNTPEFSLRWFTSNPLHGLTHNPWHPDITPGGSSGGAAAAVAVGMGCIAHGNDLGGSLRYPATCCGVATIRPSMGRIATHNPSHPERPPFTHAMSVQGPIARTIADVRLGLNSMAKRSSLDPLWTNSQGNNEEKKRRWKIGWFIDAFDDGVDADVMAATASAVSALKEAGHKLIEMPPPRALDAATIWGDMLFTETRIMAGESIQTMGSPEIAGVFEAYGTFYDELNTKGLLQAMQQRMEIQRLWSQMFDDIDVFLLPVSGQKPFLNDQDVKSPETIPDIMRAQRFLYLVNVLGLPAATVPVGVYDGMPLGVQLIGAMHDDAVCLDVAEALERAVKFEKL